MILCISERLSVVPMRLIIYKGLFMLAFFLITISQLPALKSEVQGACVGHDCCV